MSRVLLRHIFPSAPSTLCSSTTWPRRLCVTDLGHCAVAPRVLQRCPRWHPGVDTGTTPARSRETRARLETTRPCNSWELHWLPILCSESSTNCVSSCTRPWLVRCRTTSSTCSRRSPTFHRTLYCAPLATATSSNQEPSGELYTLLAHLVHGIAYRQYWNSCGRQQQHSGAIWSLFFIPCTDYVMHLRADCRRRTRAY